MRIEIVRGTIIGPLSTEKPYAFFDLDGVQITTGKWFGSDEEAIAWFEAGWPTAFKRGAEMRVYDV